jgi:hypothetical protein
MSWRAEAMIVQWSHGFLTELLDEALLCALVDVSFEFEKDLQAMCFENWASTLV